MTGSRLDIASGVAVSLFLLALWLPGGPPPMFEEWLAAKFVAYCIGLVGVVASVLRPRLLLNPLLYPVLWLLGFLVNWGQIASKYEYDYVNWKVLGAGAETVGIMAVVLLAVNGISRRARRPYRAAEPPPDPAGPEDEP